MTQIDNPFRGPRYGAVQTIVGVAEDRIRMVRDFDRVQCEAALKVPHLQKTVRRAVLARLNKLRAFDREFANESHL
ncbi:TPA: hypothetical protein QDC22_007521 [Burkholderia stabilis]|nr:hypothetical protein [Burkholderia stabilis]HDR9589132.1 hypothetical protein [Burkholderia stabilis]HDR9649528.1 hypothetical protein [Burkholderia stabilis]HDR9653594.1 hypothetical protein [Burkholderia stabilis]HDR9656289.1 hypothetical protein [Burkholderia stabilis]